MATTTEHMVDVDSLSKRYRLVDPDSNWKTGMLEALGKREKHYVQALDDISLQVRRGEVLGILGPNGAGKTTMLKVMAGFLFPDRGRVSVNGFDVIGDRHEVRCSCNFLRAGGWVIFDYRYPIDRLLEFWGIFMGLKKREAVEAVNVALKAVGLEEKRKDFPENLSAGLRQRLNLARCLLTPRPVYLLDEPTANIDPYSGDFIRQFIRKELVSKGTTVLMATHNLWEAEMFCDRIVILDQGRVRMIGTAEEIKRLAADDRIVFRMDEVGAELQKELAQMPEVVGIEVRPEEKMVDGKRHELLLVYGKEMHKNVFGVLGVVKKYGEPRYLDIQTPSLHEVFIQLVKGDEGDGTRGAA